MVRGQKKQSKNYAKAQAKVARIHRTGGPARIAHIRGDALHKLTTSLAKNHTGPPGGRIVIEDLNVRGMSKNHKLASAILDGGFFGFRRQLTYKVD